MNALLEAALGYVDAGVEIFPVWWIEKVKCA